MCNFPAHLLEMQSCLATLNLFSNPLARFSRKPPPDNPMTVSRNASAKYYSTRNSRFQTSPWPNWSAVTGWKPFLSHLSLIAQTTKSFHPHSVADLVPIDLKPKCSPIPPAVQRTVDLDAGIRNSQLLNFWSLLGCCLSNACVLTVRGLKTCWCWVTGRQNLVWNTGKVHRSKLTWPPDSGCVCKQCMKFHFKVKFKTRRFQHCKKLLERV